jgi:hypothetical protein
MKTNIIGIKGQDAYIIPLSATDKLHLWISDMKHRRAEKLKQDDKLGVMLYDNLLKTPHFNQNIADWSEEIELGRVLEQDA